jgi:hypothetical protein
MNDSNFLSYKNKYGQIQAVHKIENGILKLSKNLISRLDYSYHKEKHDKINELILNKENKTMTFLLEKVLNDLDIENVKNICNKINSIIPDEIYNIKIKNLNILENILSKKLLSFLLSNSFDYLNCKNTNAKSFYNIVDFLSTKYPKLITKNCYSYPIAYNILPILSILSSNDITNIDEDECHVCLGKCNIQMINSTCCCKSKIHFCCLLKCVLLFNNNCKTCNTSYNATIDKYQRINFPSNSIYRQPLMNDYIFIKDDDIKNKIQYAIMYLEINILENLLNNITKEDFYNYKNNANYHALHDKVDGLIQLKKNPYSNLNYYNFKEEHDKINQLLYDIEEKFSH